MKIIDLKDKSQADPYVIKSGGKFYMYCTAITGVQCYESDDLFSGWKFAGFVLKEEGRKEYWAPCVIEDGGTFYMYYSNMPADSDDVHLQNIRVAVCDSPAGEFKFVKYFWPAFSFDAQIYKNDSGLYMFYSINRYEGDRVGTYIVCDEMLDFFTMAGNPKTVVEPSLDEEIFENDRFKKGQHWHTIEGASYFKVGDWHYCTYSGNSYHKPTYHIGYASCRDAGDKLNAVEFVKHTADGAFAPLVCGNEREASTGHNSVICVDGQLYLVYHGRDVTPDGKKNERTARVCKVFASDGKLTVERI